MIYIISWNDGIVSSTVHRELEAAASDMLERGKAIGRMGKLLDEDLKVVAYMRYAGSESVVILGADQFYIGDRVEATTYRGTFAGTVVDLETARNRGGLRRTGRYGVQLDDPEAAIAKPAYFQPEELKAIDTAGILP